MKKKLLTAAYILLVAAVAVLIVKEFDLSDDIFGSEKMLRYKLYVRLDDKDTQQPVYSLNEAKQALFMIVRKYAGRCTFSEADGYWYDEEKKTAFSENSLVCVLMDVTPEAVKSIMDEALKAFNQSAILLETTEVKGVFYYGN